MKPKVFSFLKLKDLVEALREKKNTEPLLEWNLPRNEGKPHWKHTKAGWAEAQQGRGLYGPRT